MRRMFWPTGWLWALAVACGGATTSPPDHGTPDNRTEVGADILDIEDAKDLLLEEEAAPQDPGVKQDELTTYVDDGPPPAEEVASPDDGVPDALDVGEVVEPECPCNDKLVQWVCGIDDKDYVNDQCAKCALCKDNPVTCVGCTGDKDCDPTDPLGPDGWLKQKAKCEVCVCEDRLECERLHLEYPCGPFCDLAGQTWQTPCDMKKAYACNPDWDENIDYFGPCKVQVCEPCDGLPMDPVCGTDGVTYLNYCILMNCPENAGAGLAYLGRCLNAQFCPQCVAFAKIPVCGNDGVTYANECAATTCMGREVAYAGRCCVECESTGPGVCGEDFKTYPNDCVLVCLGIYKKYDGPCTCNCDLTGPEVCASNGTTQPNDCWLECLGLGKLYDGPCQGECPMCGKDFTPVCGTDNKTYQNLCWLRDCKGVNLKNNGVCSTCQSICGTPENPTGGVVPACGPDGVTYPNACFATKCVGYAESQVKPGACP